MRKIERAFSYDEKEEAFLCHCCLSFLRRDKSFPAHYSTQRCRNSARLHGLPELVKELTKKQLKLLLANSNSCNPAVVNCATPKARNQAALNSATPRAGNPSTAKDVTPRKDDQAAPIVGTPREGNPDSVKSASPITGNRSSGNGATSRASDKAAPTVRTSREGNPDSVKATRPIASDKEAPTVRTPREGNHDSVKSTTPRAKHQTVGTVETPRGTGKSSASDKGATPRDGSHKAVKSASQRSGNPTVIIGATPRADNQASVIVGNSRAGTPAAANGGKSRDGNHANVTGGKSRDGNHANVNSGKSRDSNHANANASASTVIETAISALQEQVKIHDDNMQRMDIRGEERQKDINDLKKSLEKLEKNFHRQQVLIEHNQDTNDNRFDKIHEFLLEHQRQMAYVLFNPRSSQVVERPLLTSFTSNVAGPSTAHSFAAVPRTDAPVISVSETTTTNTSWGAKQNRQRIKHEQPSKIRRAWERLTYRKVDTTESDLPPIPITLPPETPSSSRPRVVASAISTQSAQETDLDLLERAESAGALHSSDTESADHNPAATQDEVAAKKRFKMPAFLAKNKQPKQTQTPMDEVKVAPTDEKTPNDAVVYAELDLATGRKPQDIPVIRREDDKTEYAEIVHSAKAV